MEFKLCLLHFRACVKDVGRLNQACVRFRRLQIFGFNQGDQIGRIFAQWVIGYFGQFE
jgi:hypothetical protein